MTSKALGFSKRKSDFVDKSLSPPPVKRKLQSSTTQNKVAAFFTPVSQKEPDRATWRTVHDSLLIAHYEPQDRPDSARRAEKRTKIAAFDLDSTLIVSASGKKFPADADDWKWWDRCVPERLRKLDQDGYQVVIISNQGGLGLKKDSKTAKSDAKRVQDFKGRVGAMLSQLELSINVYAATQKDKYRKPLTGMWREMVEDFDLEADSELYLPESFFIGDAGGRLRTDGLGPDDFSSSDRDFADNVGIAFSTPEAYFLGEKERAFSRAFDPKGYLEKKPEHPAKARAPRFEKRNERELVLFCGSPGSGKSTFYWNHLKPLGYERVNQDTLGSRDKCIKKAREHISDGQSVAIDNTNADVETRAHWLRLAAEHGVAIRCVRFLADSKLCEHNDVVRASNGGTLNPEERTRLPRVAFTGFASRYREPSISEGFQDIITVDFEFEGGPEQRRVWGKFWVS